MYYVVFVLLLIIANTTGFVIMINVSFDKLRKSIIDGFTLFLRSLGLWCFLLVTNEKEYTWRNTEMYELFWKSISSYSNEFLT